MLHTHLIPFEMQSKPACSDRFADQGLLDVIEVFNAKISLRHLNEKAVAFAQEFDLLGVAGSDAHVPEAVGAAVSAAYPDTTSIKREPGGGA